MKQIKYFTVVLINVFFIYSCASNSSQSLIKNNDNYIQACPTIGWESLRSIIEKSENYPSNLQFSETMGSVTVFLLFDSSGTLKNVKPIYDGLDLTDDVNFKNQDTSKYNAFIPVIKKILEPIKWYPSYKDGKPIDDKFTRTFNFLLIGNNEEFNIIAPKIYIK